MRRVQGGYPHVHREREAGASGGVGDVSELSMAVQRGDAQASTVESEGGSCPMCNKAVNLAKLTVLEDRLGKRRAGADAEGGGEA